MKQAFTGRWVTPETGHKYEQIRFGANSSAETISQSTENKQLFS